MIWWLERHDRYRSERSDIDALEQSSEWLQNVSWRMENDAHLIADFEILLHGEPIALTLAYPHYFPDACPRVLAPDASRLSIHQYANGELCLELRPDNWEPAFTGAMMLESARRLLLGESPAPGVHARVASAHQSTVGQSVRFAKMRFTVPADLKEAFAQLEPNVAVEAAVSEHNHSEFWLARVRRLGATESPIWQVQGAPVSNERARCAVAVHLSDDFPLATCPSVEELTAMLETIGATDALTVVHTDKSELFIIIMHRGMMRMSTILHLSDGPTSFEYRAVETGADTPRLPDSYASLAGKSVAIVGCGSVGSKVATSLARVGVGKFVLVDGDILAPGNLVRNDLDARAVGLNKPDALRIRLLDVNANTQVIERRQALGGQESSSFTEVTLDHIASCDLIIDATAEPVSYNLCGSVAKRQKIPMIWGEIYEGGIGGMVVRLRPDHDPVPHAARRQVVEWCALQGIEWTGKGAGSYEHQGHDGHVMVADDGDVSVIAAHLTRMAIDTLVRADTLFPSSAYTIGLAPEWIFTAPFEVFPIDLAQEGVWGPDEVIKSPEEMIALMAEFFPNKVEAGAD
ncbi:thiamin biosynthesis protein [Novosphingobium barchaimii LL02]|uniref:Thiamin biosynthesis protein n=1 Tax=Novosphingobium barchaimii LL02 TaxID=1114963 RepID=A0A0J7XXD8_9SPHN|nr:ThiF family adenylyltransferase [Novosphingobium barchaimii]KMS56194.1 thiamin biosynthesis protein [Novosphingobium barchaimii LL02]